MTPHPVATPPPPPPSLAIGEAAFRSWVGRAEPGKRLEYHRGHLASDRTRGMSPFGEKLRCELNAVADLALALAEQGHLFLIQQRHGPSDYSYFAVMVGRPGREALAH